MITKRNFNRMKLMEKRTRTILFSFLVLLFILVTPVIILYSEGYRFDFEDRKLTKTGALFLRVTPNNSEVYLDETLIKKTDFLFGVALVESLIPKEYKIVVKKENYFPWEKNLAIKERLVTEIKNITLVPNKVEFKNLNNKIKNFWLAPNQKEMIIQKINNSNKEENNNWSLKLLDLERNIKTNLTNEKNVLGKIKTTIPSKILDITFSADSKTALLKVNIKDKEQYFIIDLTATPARLTPLSSLKEKSEQVSINPRTSIFDTGINGINTKKVFFLEDGNLFKNDINELSGDKLQLVLDNIITYQLTEDNIYYLDQSGWIFKTNYSFNMKEKLISQPLALEKDKNYQLKTYWNFIFILEDETLYWIKPKDRDFLISNPETKSFEKLLSNMESLEISPSFGKISFSSANEIWILSLKKEDDQPNRKFGEKTFLIRFSEKINNIFWWTDHYLIFTLGDKIKIIEVDNRDKINIYDLPSSIQLDLENNNFEILWNNDNKKLYILTEKNLYESEELIE